jgi:NADH-quinone oxidoreductase subunit A
VTLVQHAGASPNLSMAVVRSISSASTNPQPTEPTVPSEYLPILILIVIAAVFAVIALAMPALFGPKRTTKARLEPYESGMLPYSDARRRFPVQYYVVAVLFILFDIEVIFLYPWAVVLRQLKLFGLIQMAIFLAILVIGFIYVWRKGALEW